MLPIMAQPPDLEARVTALEEQVRDLGERVRNSQQDAAAARVLAGGADRDVTEMRSEIREFREQNTRVLNAMREDLADLRSHVDGGFARIDGKFAQVDGQFARVDRGFAEMRGKLNAAAAGQEQIARMLSVLIARDDGPSDAQ
jgi:chromosome segregation ATPase